jgi:hypothetical protein
MILSSTRSGSWTSSGVGFRNSLRKLEPLGNRGKVERFVTEAFGVDDNDKDDERGYRPGLGGRGPGPALRAVGEYGRD